MAERAITRTGKPTAATALGDPALLRVAIIAMMVCGGYYLTARIGFVFALQPGSVSTLWMPNAILLAGLLLAPKRWWWLLILVAVPAHFASEWQSGVPPAMILSWFFSNAAQALIGATCIYRLVDGRLRFDKFRDVTIFLLFGAFLAPFLTSFLDIGLMRIIGWGHGSYFEIWRVRFLANVLATLTLVPVLVMWVTSSGKAVRTLSLARMIEAVLLATGLFAIGIIVFTSERNMAVNTATLLYLPMPFLVWATVRFGPRGASTSLLLIMFLTIAGATRGRGPFVGVSSAYAALSIQWFLIVVSIPLIALAAVVDERRQAGETARNNEERLTLALNAAQMGTWDWQITDGSVVLSDTSRRMFGLTADEPAPGAEAFYSMIHPDDRASVRVAMSKALEEVIPYEAEYRMVHQGNTRWVLGKGKVLCDESGRRQRMLGVNVDITERKLAEQALLESNERYRAILRALPDMMFLQSREGTYLDYYARDVKALLTPPETFLGKNVRDIMPPDLSERFMTCVQQLNGLDETQVLEYSLPIANEERHYEARLVGAAGDKVLSIVRDVTEPRRAADALRLSEEKLRQSNRRIRALAARLISAQDSERRRISLLLHDDVSQNIAAIGIAISRLKRKPPTSPAQMVTELDRLGQQTNDLTTQIRELSHQLHPEVLEHMGLVAALESQVRDFGHEAGLAVSFAAEVSGEPIPSEVALCLYRVALEALRNVIRHSGAHFARVALSESEGHLTLEVSDSGQGFDIEKARQGSGIGVVSAEERVQLLQGIFEIRSTPETGTVLVARVPLAKGEAT